MGSGFLEIHASTGEKAMPISGAKVKITRAGETLYETTTDQNGMTQRFTLTAPDKDFTLDQNYHRPAYSTVDVTVSAPGFVTEHINGVAIVDTQIGYLPVNMKPLAAEENPVTNNTINIPTIGLLSEETYRKIGTNSPRLISQRVLSQVIIPEYITVHLGTPSNTSARNIRVKFSDYVKNVASSEIYSTWPRNSLVANIHAITTFALNRIYTEWYRNRGYNFDITNNTGYDQSYREGGPIFENISQITDEIFNVYAHRYGFRNPFFTQFCNGSTVTCPGLSQWGTVTLANQGKGPLEILRYYYPNDLMLTESNNITGITESFPGYSLTVGSNGDSVRRMQNFLNRIRINYPLIPRIENPNGNFGSDTAEAVRVFQRTFNLPADGVIDRATWNKISSIYTNITKLAELDSEGSRISIGQNPPISTISQGSRGNDVLELQFILNSISAFYPEIPTVIQDSLFDARDRNAVIEFQKKFGLTPDGVVGPATWNKLYEVYLGIKNNAPVPPAPPVPESPPFPGTVLKIGSRGENVKLIQEHLNVIGKMHPNIPALVADGVFGPMTQRSVIAFQQQFLLTPDGIVDSITWNKIMEQYNIATGNIPQEPVSPPNYFKYTVIAGDSLWKIAQKFQTTVETIKLINNLTSDIINVGQMLTIPNSAGSPPSFDYIVQPGDTLWLLSQRFGTTINAIKAINNLTSDVIKVEQILKIPSENGTEPLSITTFNAIETNNLMNSGQVPNIPNETAELPSTASEYFEYTVVPGDALCVLVQRFGTTVEKIRSLNNLTSNILSTGQVLKIPKNTSEISPTPSTSTEYFLHTVQVGDTLSQLARRFNTTIEEIKALNNLTSDFLNIGQVLRIPGNSLKVSTSTLPPTEYSLYTVQAGDTLWQLARRFNTTIEEIKALNNLTSDLLNIGQVLRIPGNSPTATPPSTEYSLHTVQAGDTLWQLARRFGTTIEEIKTLNNLTSNILNIGQILKIPESKNINFSKTIVIDAGHGGSDPGAVNGDRLEKDDNLRLALAVQKNLLSQNQKVIMTRDTDVFVPLTERSNISNRNNADMFVSLHRNASTNPDVNGAETFVQINSAPINTTYARNVQNAIVSVGVQSNRGVSQENFSVLRNTNAPAMLVEMGFISNSKDNELFDQNLDAYASAITSGILTSLGD